MVMQLKCSGVVDFGSRSPVRLPHMNLWDRGHWVVAPRLLVKPSTACGASSSDGSLRMIFRLANLWPLGISGALLVLHLAALYSAPLQALLGLTTLSLREWQTVAVLVGPLYLMELLLRPMPRPGVPVCVRVRSLALCPLRVRGWGLNLPHRK